MLNKNNKQSGVIKLVILIVVVIIILSYFGINLQKIAESETGRANFAYVWGICQQIWGWFVDLYQKYASQYTQSFLKVLPKTL